MMHSLPPTGQILPVWEPASRPCVLKEGESANTRRSYAGALRNWATWFQLRYAQSLTLPVAAPALLQFLVDHIEP